MIRFWAVIIQQLSPWQHFEYFWVLTFVGLPQPKPMYGFSPSLQDMFTRSRADKVWKVPGNTCCHFIALNAF